MTRLVKVEVKVEISWNCALKNGADLYVNKGQKLSWTFLLLLISFSDANSIPSLAEGKKKKEKSRFLTVCGSVGRLPFWTVGS